MPRHIPTLREEGPANGGSGVCGAPAKAKTGTFCGGRRGCGSFAVRSFHPPSRLTGEGKDMVSETPPSSMIMLNFRNQFCFASDQLITTQHSRPGWRPYCCPGRGGAAWRWVVLSWGGGRVALVRENVHFRASLNS
jgi:hypothetical protein